MSAWTNLFDQPAAQARDRQWEAWFAALAQQLLNAIDLFVAGEPYRFAELEFYYRSADHPDPFTHGDPLQRERGRWYFHRTGGVYRGGSFKGLDLTCGDGEAYGGILIRSIAPAEGDVIDGPSLCVDHLLARTGQPTVAALAQLIGDRQAWDESSPLVLRSAATPRQQNIFSSARVGLSLKKAKTAPTMPAYIVRRYRFLSEPRRIAKGKLHLVLALHRAGASMEEMHRLTGCPRSTIQRYLADFDEGSKAPACSAYFGIDLTPRDLCRLHGTCHAQERPKQDDGD